MVKRRVLPALLILLAILTASCSKPTLPQLKWTGQALEGARFGEREMGLAVVHYAAPTSPTTAETIANAAVMAANAQARLGRIFETERLHVWVVPAGWPWPAGISPAPAGRSAIAGAPLAVVMREETGKDGGLTEATAVAATQGDGSPVLQVGWLHEGTGAALSAELVAHPGPNLRKAVAEGGKAIGMLAALNGPAGDERYRAAALALATLVMDRWGVAWSTHYPRTAAELTPAAALTWATGAETEAEALRLWQERLDLAVRTGEGAFPAIADISPVRVEAKLPQLPPGPGPNANYSAQSYTINARYEPEQRRVAGEEQLRWQNGEQIPIDTLYFNLWPNTEQFALNGASMAIASVAVDGQAVPFQARALDLVVPLGRTVAPGETATVDIKFKTRMPGTISGRVLGQTSDRFNLAHWFPILAVLDDRGWNLPAFPTYPGEPYSENASFHVTLDVPAGLTMVATGHPEGRTERDGRWVYAWTAPNVKDWIAAGGRNYREDVRQVGPVTIRVLDKTEAVTRPILDETERALKLFEPQFGPYPYPDLAVVPCCNWVEFPGLFYTQPASSSAGNWWHTVLYHELAHQWFYGAVGNDQYTEAWLDEGFARYGERYGVRYFGYDDQLRDIRSREIPSEVFVNSSSLQFNIYGGYTQAVYDWGAALLEDLEDRLGAAKFRSLLQQWTATYRFKTATTADFIRLAESVAGEDLSAFFREHKIDPTAREPYRPVMPLGSVVPR